MQSLAFRRLRPVPRFPAARSRLPYLTGIVILAGAVASAPAHGSRSGLRVGSHLLERKLEPGVASKVLPAHRGARLSIRSATRVRRLLLSWRTSTGRTKAIRATAVGSSFLRWTLRLPRGGALPTRIRVVASFRGGARRRYELRLRQHVHARLRTEETGRTFVVWAYQPRSFGEMVRRSGAAVVADVLAVRAGSPVGPTGDPHLQVRTQRVTFRVTQRWFGRIGSRFTLFKSGDDTSWGEGDPPYKPGERYVLYLDRERFTDGSWKFIAPDGRFRVIEGLLRPTYAAPVGRQVSNLTVEETRSATLQHRR